MFNFTRTTIAVPAYYRPAELQRKRDPFFKAIPVDVIKYDFADIVQIGVSRALSINLMTKVPFSGLPHHWPQDFFTTGAGKISAFFYRVDVNR